MIEWCIRLGRCRIPHPGSPVRDVGSGSSVASATAFRTGIGDWTRVRKIAIISRVRAAATADQQCNAESSVPCFHLTILSG